MRQALQFTLKRVMSEKNLASFAAGLYGVNVQGITDPAVIGLWAGTVRLPLMRAPCAAPIGACAG